MSALAIGEHCWIGPLQLHTLNYGHTECIWCGPNRLAWQPGEWVPVGDGVTEWRAAPAPLCTECETPIIGDPVICLEQRDWLGDRADEWCSELCRDNAGERRDVTS